MGFTVVLGQVFILFLLISLGYLSAKKGMIAQSSIKTLSAIVVNFGLAGLVISSIFNGPVVERSVVVKIILVSSLMYLPPLAMALFTGRLPNATKQQQGVYTFMLLFPNAGFMGYPMVLTVFGEKGLFYATLSAIPFYLLVYSLGIYYMSMGQQGTGKGDMLKKLTGSIPFLTALLAVAVYLAGIPCPAILVRTAKYLADMSTPLSMIVIGATLSSLAPGEIFRNYPLYAVSAGRLLLTPLVTYFLVSLFISDPLVVGVATLISAMPVAANSTMLAVEYQSDALLASQGVFLSTLLSALSIPLVVYCLQR